MIGEELGSYRVVEPIGKGGMASVYVGEHLALGRRVAIKVLHPVGLNNPSVERRFVNEAKVVASIRHPGIVEIFDFGRGPGGQAYIVMELLHGQTLRDRMRRDGPVPLDKVLVFGRQIATAVAVAHDAGIIHRDLKPDNIFLVADAEVEFGERIKVLDFGVAKQVDALKPASEETATGVLVGTPAYMSPEQCKGVGKIDRRSDVYSLGIVLFRMITGELPFDCAGTGELIGKHIFEVPPVVAELDPRVPGEISDLIVKCLAKEPEDRYQDMHEVANQLRRISIEVLGHRPSQMLPLRPPVVESSRAPSGKGHIDDDEDTHPTTLRSATGQIGEERPVSPWTWPLAIGGALGLAVFVALLIASSGDQVQLPSSGSPGPSSRAIDKTPALAPEDSKTTTTGQAGKQEVDGGPAAARQVDADTDKKTIPVAGDGKTGDGTDETKAEDREKGAAPTSPTPSDEPASETATKTTPGASAKPEPAESTEPKRPAKPAATKPVATRPVATRPVATRPKPAPVKPRPRPTRTRPISEDRAKTKKPERIPVPTLY